MALENPALNERSFQRGIEEAGAEPRGMSAAGTYAITGLLLVLVVAAAAFTAGAVGRAIGRSGERSSDEHKRSRDGHDG
jgi:hypothetical protein